MFLTVVKCKDKASIFYSHQLIIKIYQFTYAGSYLFYNQDIKKIFCLINIITLMRSTKRKNINLQGYKGRF